jgi:hypothetical protein
MLRSTRQHREQHADHSGIHNLSHKHTPTAASLQLTPDHANQHPISYLFGKQYQTLVTSQVDDN